jgi:transposase-like protein
MEGGTRPCATQRISARKADALSSDPTVGSFSPCPRCGKPGKRVRVVDRMIRHIALGQRVWIHGRVGVYRSRCGCSKRFQAPVPGIPKGGRYSLEVRNVVANALVRDRLPYRMVQERMAEDFELRLSLGYIHDCFRWAHDQIDNEARLRWAVENFSGVMCIDEVHDGGRTILYATDPLSDFTINFDIVERNDQEHMDAFLRALRDRGIVPEVAITDGSPLYKDALAEIWRDIEHQLCVFHVIKEVNKLLLDAVREVKNGIKRQGNKGRRRRRGRPSRQQQKRRSACSTMTRKEQARLIWKHQHLIVKKAEGMTEEEKTTLDEMLGIAPQLKTIRRFNQEFYRLFQRDLTKQQARYRRTRMANNHSYQSNPFLARGLKKLRKARFEKIITFLGREDGERTSNHVERNNRSFRMLQKTRYKRRRTHTIRMSIELDLYARMLKHELFAPSLREGPPFKRPTTAPTIVSSPCREAA